MIITFEHNRFIVSVFFYLKVAERPRSVKFICVSNERTPSHLSNRAKTRKQENKE